MIKEFKMPSIGMGMTDATILQWFKDEGDPVARDEPVAEIEAAKTIVEIHSPIAGVLDRILVKVAENADVGTPIALIRVEE